MRMRRFCGLVVAGTKLGGLAVLFRAVESYSVSQAHAGGTRFIAIDSCCSRKSAYQSHPCLFDPATQVTHDFGGWGGGRATERGVWEGLLALRTAVWSHPAMRRILMPTIGKTIQRHPPKWTHHVRAALSTFRQKIPTLMRYPFPPSRRRMGSRRHRRASGSKSRVLRCRPANSACLARR